MFYKGFSSKRQESTDNAESELDQVLHARRNARWYHLSRGNLESGGEKML